MPRRVDVDPLEMPTRLLPSVLLTEVVDIFVLAPRQYEFPHLTDDNAFIGVCEAVIE